jgi:hypothetical protein
MEASVDRLAVTSAPSELGKTPSEKFYSAGYKVVMANMMRPGTAGSSSAGGLAPDDFGGGDGRGSTTLAPLEGRQEAPPATSAGNEGQAA